MVALLVLTPSAARASGSFIGPFDTVRTVASTVPTNGDVNPYGVAVVPRSNGNLVKDQVLISNFNAKSNLQGTGTTIVEISASGARRLFATINAANLHGSCPGGVGLSTALVVLRSGWVIVGSLPTTDGTSKTAKAGCLIVLDSWGHVAESFAGGHINGPWDMTAFDMDDEAALFFTNVLNGTVAAGGQVVNGGTVVRMNLAIADGQKPRLISSTVIGSGFPERTDPAALVIGPTGLGLSGDGKLYVADSLDNATDAIPFALFRTSAAGPDLVSKGIALNDPLGLAMAPNGDILTVNGNNGRIVETTPSGVQVAMELLDSTGSPPGAGTLFGLAVVPGGSGIYFVDDGTNTLNLLHD
ncbi:MAG: hypothetical protein DLM70_04340 [Chloroflexi bacterium]|nr:MAG: hypothetical protein DLM70_04340 [Chloroflexota bacterium]